MDRNKELLISLNNQHPATWTTGMKYKAINPFTNREVLIQRTTYRKTGERFLHIYMPCKIKVKTASGEILDVRDSFHHFRGNLGTYEIVQI